MKRFIFLLKQFLKWLLSLFARKKVTKKPEVKLSSSEESKSRSTSSEEDPYIKKVKEIFQGNKNPQPVCKRVEKDSNSLIVETFNSIGLLIDCLSKRKNNSVMKSCDSSETTTYSFSRTHSYSEAVQLLRNGYLDVLPEIKKDYKKQVEVLSQRYVRVKSKNIDNIFGGCPNIPRALMCLPKDLQNREIVSRKLKTVCIVYAINASANTPGNVFIECGKVLLSAIELLELSGIQLKLICTFYSGFKSSGEDSEYIIGSVLLKNYSDRLNIKKLCFPLVHPSMLRRIGFKFLETVPGMKNNSFKYGYGTPMETDQVKIIYNNVSPTEKPIVISINTIQDTKFNVENLIKYIEDNAKK